jgi:hypothetical protein
MRRSADLAVGAIESEESGVSAVSWSAIFGGAVAAAAVTMILVALGSGIGFSAASPWPGAGDSPTAFGVKAAVWLIVVQWLSSGFGGYLAGRLRAKWVGIHDDESYFRDTAHGVLAWAVASLIVAIVLSSTAGSVIGGAARGAASLASTAGPALAQAAGSGGNTGGRGGDPTAYMTDTLFRADHATTIAPETRAEAGRILLTGFGSGGISDADKAYLAQLVAASTGLSQDDAGKRVDAVIAKVKDQEARLRQAADTARKSAAYGSFFLAFSLLIGAFIAAAAGALGGQHRDRMASVAGRL